MAGKKDPRDDRPNPASFHFVPLQLPLAPMRLFPICEHRRLDVACSARTRASFSGEAGTSPR
jgi:hypothetical protein